MNRFRRLTSLFCVAALAAATQGQKPRVHLRYDKDSNRTEAAANVLYVLNTPEQFVQLQMRGLYWGRQLLFPAEEVTLELFSFAAGAKYRAERDRRLVAVIDGKSFEFAPRAYAADGGGGAREALPAVARVGGKLVMESFSFAVEPEQLALLAGARGAELRLGATPLPLDENHKSIVREFVSHIIPPEGATPQPGSGVEEVAAQLPPELKDAPLEATLKWLQASLIRHGTTSRRGDIKRLAVSYSGCGFVYRVVSEGERLPTWNNSKFDPFWWTDYTVDLSDVSPESVRAYAFKEFAYVYFRVRGGERKIRLDFSSTDYSHLQSGTSLTLNKTKAVPGIAAALAQAVRQCQPKP